jgi:methionine-rich copper-binding protein CopC
MHNGGQSLIRKLILAGGALAAILGVLTAQTVFAHSRPVRFDTPAGAVLTAAPSQVTGWFTQPLRRDPEWNFLRVTDAQGNRVDVGEPTLSGDRKQMSVSLRPGLGEGRYQVTWRTWDDNDGRIFGDCYAFFVGQAAADAAVAANSRLDGGNTCQRIDVPGTQGTPVAGGTPQATAVPEDHEDEADEPMTSAETEGGDDSDGVPVWTVVLGAIAGMVIGGVGGRMLSGKS